MKQILQSYRTGEMKLEEVPRPQVLPGMVLVQTKASVISAGTEKSLVGLAKKSLLGKAAERPDLVRKVMAAARKEGFASAFQKARSRLDAPVPLGYSCCGVVMEAGEGAGGFQAGDLVSCGGSGYANHAEYNLVPKNLCSRVPFRLNSSSGKECLSFEEAAFGTIGAIALQGVRQAAPTLGERVCIIGLGLIGQLTVQICRAAGCRTIGADIDPWKIETAAGLGADMAVHSLDLPGRIREFTEGAGADAVIITAAAKGSDLVALAGEVSRLKGRVVVVGLVGLDVPRDVYYRKELDLRLSMSYGPGRYDAEYEQRGHDYPLPYVRWTEQRNMQSFLELVAAGRVDVKPLISHRFPFDQALNAYEMIASGRENILGVVLHYAPRPEAPRISQPKEAAPLPGGSVRLGVVGAGNFARGVLLPRLKKDPRVKLHAVSTARGISARAVSDRFGFGYCSSDVDELIADEDVNSVLIATRHNLHGPLVLKALEAGKHVFVEKPLCLNREELAKIAEKYLDPAAGGRASILMTGFNRRFSPLVRRIREELKDRGTPLIASYHINAGFVPRDSWIQDPVAGGGRIIGEVCHFVDTLRFLTGAAVRTVQAASIRTGDAGLTDKDSIAVTLTYHDGSVAAILYHALGNARFPKEKLEVSADGKVMVLDDFCRLEIFGRRKEKIKAGQDKGFDAEIDAFLGAVVGGGPAPIPFSEICEATEVTFAIHEAIDAGRLIHLENQRP